MNAALVFLKRLRHCRGFGIQSPSDFAFVNEVVYERMPYYAYGELDMRYEGESLLNRKIARLLFRVANFAQPSTIILPDSTPPLFADHIRAARTSAVVLSAITGKGQVSADDRTFSSEGVSLTYADSIAALPSSYRDGDCIIVPDIYTTGREQWLQLTTDRSRHHLILFDLYYVGIAFVRERRYPELHIVNFY